VSQVNPFLFPTEYLVSCDQALAQFPAPARQARPLHLTCFTRPMFEILPLPNGGTFFFDFSTLRLEISLNDLPSFDLHPRSHLSSPPTPRQVDSQLFSPWRPRSDIALSFALVFPPLPPLPLLASRALLEAVRSFPPPRPPFPVPGSSPFPVIVSIRSLRLLATYRFFSRTFIPYS